MERGAPAVVRRPPSRATHGERASGTRSVEEAYWATGAVRNRSVVFFPSSFRRTGKGRISQIRSEPSRSHAGVSVDIPLPRPPRASLGLTRFGRVLGPSVRLELSAGAAPPGTAPHPALRGRGHRVVDEVGRLRSPAVRRTLSLPSSFTAVSPLLRFLSSSATGLPDTTPPDMLAIVMRASRR